jgi:UDP-3-O-[3-hydroxymyristoyl] glucosamine N-acyltransferase
MVQFEVNEIADLINGRIIGSTEISITGIKGIELASTGDLTFLYQDKYLKYLADSNATCIIVPEDIKEEPKTGQVFIKTNDPYGKFVEILNKIEAMLPKQAASIHKTAIIGNNCLIDESVYLGAYVVVGDNCIISSGTMIKPNVTIYDNVIVGSNTLIHSNVVLYQGVNIGNNCILHAGSIIGSDGFGYIENKETGEYTKIPQLGIVEIEDNVEIGANTTIDRALVGKTIIRKGTKIDNLVQIAHNCDIGENTGIASQAGISGSVKSGKRGRFGGQAGIAGHLEIVDDVTILAQSGIPKSVKQKGIYFGSPAKEHFKAFKIEAVLRQLPELFEEVYKLKKQISEKY